MTEKYCHGLFLTGVLTLAGCATTAGGEAAPGDGAMLGAPVPAIAVKGLDGREVSPGALKGRVVLLDFWASWCGPCKEELTIIDKMDTRLRARGVTILAVSVDENRDDAVAFLKSRGSDWTLAIGHDPEGRLADRFKPPKMPTSYIIDRAGIIRQVNSGFERADVAKIEARLTELAEQP
jgi:thiol-disulfide isomerase/thioredoxin